jgi:outer membrane protein TolC
MPCFSQDKEVLKLNLSDCINMALDTNPAIIKARANIDVAEANITQALSTFYPVVKLNSQYNRTNANTTSISGGGGNVVTTPARQSSSTNFSITQRIFDSFKTWRNYKYADAQLENIKYAFEETSNNLSLNVTKYYFEVIAVKHLVKLDETLLLQSKNHLDQTNANYKAGIAPKADTYSAQVNVTQAQVNLLEAQNSLRIQMANLKNLIGLKREVNIEVVEESFELNYKPLLPEAITSAINKRPELKEMLAQIEAQSIQIDILTLNVMPQLTVDVGFNLDAARDPALPDNSYTIQANFTLPLFDGFNSAAKIDAAKANMTGLEAGKLDVEKSISLEVETSYYNLETAFSRIELTSQQVEEANKNLQVAEGRYKAGVSPFQELLDAQVTFSRTMTEFITAKYRYQIALFTFKKAIGEELL